jgi:hypothetical protein
LRDVRDARVALPRQEETHGGVVIAWAANFTDDSVGYHFHVGGGVDGHVADADTVPLAVLQRILEVRIALEAWRTMNGDWPLAAQPAQPPGPRVR